jgi:hypothetical protein
MKKMLFAILASLCAGAALGAQPASAPSLQGVVLETKDADPYTYLRLKTKNGETWAAVMKAPVSKGAQVTIVNPMTMTNFKSQTLGRTFDTIVFGTLAAAPGSPAASTAKGASPMPGQAGAGMGGAGAMPGHPNVANAAADVPVEKVAKAAGPDARTVAEVYAQRAQLKGKPVVVHGKVVKVSNNIMGKNWVHLRDGTGSAADGSNDLLVTTKNAAQTGGVVTARGVVHTDVDLGMGYTYKALVEDATLK